jgi:2-methylisocitrate lyase-like PEP mutase family enzyme
MPTQAERAAAFAQLHVKGNPLLLYNIWDAGSARIVQEAGAKAIATGSWAVAMAHGMADGEAVPIELVLANARRIVAEVDLPVTLDFESGYGRSPADVQRTVAQAIETGVIGINFEDQIIGGEGLYSIDEQSARIAAIRRTAGEMSVPLFINARCDVFFTGAAEYGPQHLDEAIARAHAYAQAGASGYFVPGLQNADFIRTLCSATDLPVNILYRGSGVTPKQLAELGVARISVGGYAYRTLMASFKEQVAAFFEAGE